MDSQTWLVFPAPCDHKMDKKEIPPHKYFSKIEVTYSGFLKCNYIFVKYYLAGLYFGATDSLQNIFQCKFAFNEILYCHIYGGSLKSTLTV